MTGPTWHNVSQPVRQDPSQRTVPRWPSPSNGTEPITIWMSRSWTTVLTPHIGYVSRETYAVFYGEAVQDIARWLDGSPVRILA
jgi:hypothetical protein